MVLSPGVLETSDQGDREAFQKAKILYKSCMNESESLLVLFLCSIPNIQPEQRSRQYPCNLCSLIWNIILQPNGDAFVYGMDAAYHPETCKAFPSECKTAIHFILSKAIQSN